MSANDINALTKIIADEVASAGADIGNTDPELWEHLFEDDILEGLRSCAPSSSPAETSAFRGLYAQIKTVTDQALIPADLVEAFHVIKYQVAKALAEIAKKDKTAGAEIVADINKSYRAHPDIHLRSFAKALTQKIGTLAGDASASAEFSAAAAPAGTPNPVLAGKTVVFTGTLSIKRDAASKIATDFGLRVAKTVSKNTDYVVVGEDAGKKRREAEEKGITVLTEQQWNDLLRNRMPAEAPSPHATTQAVTLLPVFRFKT